MMLEASHIFPERAARNDFLSPAKAPTMGNENLPREDL